MFTILSNELEVYLYPYFSDKEEGPYYWAELYLPDINNVPLEIKNLLVYKTLPSFEQLGIYKILIDPYTYYNLYYSPNNNYQLFINYIASIYPNYLDNITCYGKTDNLVQESNSNEEASLSEAERVATDIFKTNQIDQEEAKDLYQDIVNKILDGDYRGIVNSINKYYANTIDFISGHYYQDCSEVFHLIKYYGALDSFDFYRDLIVSLETGEVNTKTQKQIQFIRDNTIELRFLLEISPGKINYVINWYKDWSNTPPFNKVLQDKDKVHEVNVLHNKGEITKEQARDMLGLD